MSRETRERLFPVRGRGFSLLELLISGALFSVMAGSIYLLYTTMQSTMTYGELNADLQQNARVGLAQMTQELRMAGYDLAGVIPQVLAPTPQPRAAIRSATAVCLSFVADVKGSGTSSQISYSLNGTTLRRQQDAWNGTNAFTQASPQPLAESVNSLTLTYYDADIQEIPMTVSSTRGCPPEGTPLPQSTLQLDSYQMQQIRRVTVVLRTKDKRPGVLTDQLYTLTSDVRIRNK